jgi:hypothetical protein
MKSHRKSYARSISSSVEYKKSTESISILHFAVFFPVETYRKEKTASYCSIKL